MPKKEHNNFAEENNIEITKSRSLSSEILSFDENIQHGPPISYNDLDSHNMSSNEKNNPLSKKQEQDFDINDWDVISDNKKKLDSNNTNSNGKNNLLSKKQEQDFDINDWDLMSDFNDEYVNHKTMPFDKSTNAFFLDHDVTHIPHTPSTTTSNQNKQPSSLYNTWSIWSKSVYSKLKGNMPGLKSKNRENNQPKDTDKTQVFYKNKDIKDIKYTEINSNQKGPNCD